MPSQPGGVKPFGAAEPTAVEATRHADGRPTTLSDALTRMDEAEETLRAIGAGEIDAVVVSDGGSSRRLFTLSTADRPYRMFVENMSDGAATVSTTGIVLYINNRLAQLLGRTSVSILGSPLSTFLADDESMDWFPAHDGNPLRASVECDLLTGQGKRLPVLVGVSTLGVDDDRITCLTFTDLSARRAQEQEIARLGVLQTQRFKELQDAQAALTRQATHDLLTGLPNRGLLMDRMDQALGHARRSGNCTAVFFVDLDNFKHINDTHGHAAGDEVLKATADRLARSIRSMDTVARIGGDEFVVLAPDVDNELHAVDIGTRLIAGLTKHSPVSEDEQATASIGIAVSVAGRGTAESLLNEADAAMYQAKSQGGSCAVIFDARLGVKAHQRAAERKVLQSALDLHKVLAFYQPIINLADGLIAGFEALARLSGRGGTIVQPYEFIPIAEESGLVVTLGSQVLELACSEAVRWRSVHRTGPLSVAVNLSARQFENGKLVSTVRHQLIASGLPPGSLHLELTETATIDLRHDVLQQLGELRDLGVEIGLDDFGTGYGSLTHLRRLPLTFVKIDQTFVDGLGRDDEDERIVAAVTTLATKLGLRSIAEGVETPEQLQVLRNIGCDQAQGYLIARPMPTSDIGDALALSSR